MDKPLVEIMYQIAEGKRIRLEVSSEVKNLLAQADRQIRSQRRQDRRYLDNAEYIDGLTDSAMLFPQEDIADLLIRMDSYQKLYAGINKLSEVQRRRLKLYFFDRMTYREIAALEGVNHKAVIRSVEQAIRRLRKYCTD